MKLTSRRGSVTLRAALSSYTTTQSCRLLFPVSNRRLQQKHRGIFSTWLDGKARRVDDKVMITGEDEFRLLFLKDILSEMYANPPLCPYAPFGEVDVKHTSLEVRLHFSCNHRLVCRSWEWVCQGGQSLSDFGAPLDSQSFEDPFKTISLPSIWIVPAITYVSLPRNCSGRGTFSMMRWVSRTSCSPKAKLWLTQTL